MTADLKWQMLAQPACAGVRLQLPHLNLLHHLRNGQWLFCILNEPVIINHWPSRFSLFIPPFSSNYKNQIFLVHFSIFINQQFSANFRFCPMIKSTLCHQLYRIWVLQPKYECQWQPCHENGWISKGNTTTCTTFSLKFCLHCINFVWILISSPPNCWWKFQEEQHDCRFWSKLVVAKLLKRLLVVWHLGQ